MTYISTLEEKQQFLQEICKNRQDAEIHAEHMLRRCDLHHMMRKYSRIPSQLVSRLMESYYLLYWEASYLLDNMNTNGGKVLRGGILHTVAYEPGMNRGKLLAADKNAQIPVSFRVPLAIYNLPAYVYICTPVEDKEYSDV